MAAWRHLRARSLWWTLGAGFALCVVVGLAFWVVAPLAALAAWAAGVVAVAVLWWVIPRRVVGRARRQGLLVDEEVQLVATEDGLLVDRGGRRRRVAWHAVHKVVPGARHLYLHVASAPTLGRRAFAIPRRVLGDRAAQAGFVAQIRTWMEGGTTNEVPEDPDPGRDRWVLRFRLVVDDYVLFTRVLRAEQLRRRPLSLAVMAALTGGVLLVSAEPWQGDVDIGVVGLMALFSLSLVALGLASSWVPQIFTPWLVRRTLAHSPGRMPSGQVGLGLGPEGGWVQSQQGVTRFGWRELLRVHSNADQVLLLFSDQEGVIVPSRAFTAEGDQDALVADVENWHRAALEGGGPTAPRSGAPRRAVSMGNPFEPPGGV